MGGALCWSENLSNRPVATTLQQKILKTTLQKCQYHFEKPCSFTAQFSSKWLYNYICERNPVGYYSNYRPQSFLAAFREIICVMKWRFPAAANKPISNLFCKWQDILNGVIKLGSICWLCICLDLGDSLFQSRKWLRAACYLKNPQTLSKMINNAKKIKIEPTAITFKCNSTTTAPALQVLLYTEAEDKGLLELWTYLLWWSERKFCSKQLLSINTELHHRTMNTVEKQANTQ